MKKLVALLFLFSLTAQAQNIPIVPNIVLGQISEDVDSPPGTSAIATSTERLACGITVPVNKTLSKVRVYISAVTGTLAASDMEFTLRADSSGSPNMGAALETKTPAAAPTGAQWVETTSYTTALTAATQYWIVVRNANGTPASNYPTPIRWGGYTEPASPHGLNGNSYEYGWAAKASSDSGSSWATGGADRKGPCAIRLEFSDGTFSGFTLTSNGPLSIPQIYGSAKRCAKFVYPASYPEGNLAYASCAVNKAGSGPTTFFYSLYTGSSTTPTLVDSTLSVTGARLIGRWVPLPFATDQTLTPGTTYRLCHATTGGNSSNDARTWQWTMSNDATDRSLLPLEGFTSSYSSDGITFTDEPTVMIPCVLGLNLSAPFATSGSGAGRSQKINTGFGGL